MGVLRGRGEQHEDRETFQPRLYLKLAALLFVVGYGIAFVVENDRGIDVDFVFATANVSLIWEILLLLGLGVVWGVAISQLYRHRRRRKDRAEPAHALADVGDRDEAVSEAGGAPPARAAEEEVGAPDEGDTRPLGADE